MKFKTLSLYTNFMKLLHKDTGTLTKYVRIGDMRLTFRLLNTAHLSAESKLTYAYLFFHRQDVTGFKVPVLSQKLGMTSEQIRSTLAELKTKNHIKLITTQQSADFSELTYYYEIVNPERYGMLDLEKEHLNEEKEITPFTLVT